MKFTDVPDTHWASGAIEHGANKGYINGYEDGTFRPSGNITRAEVCAIIARRDPSFNPNTLYHVNFSDCTGTEWYTTYISYCYLKKYIDAFPSEAEGRIDFRPNQPATREEVAVMIANTIKEV